jgi:hypothetical protein
MQERRGGKKNPNAFNPEIFFPAALVFHSSSEFLTKKNHHQHNKTKQVNKQANNVHNRVSSCHCNSTRGRLPQCTTQQILGKSLWNVLSISLSLATPQELGIQNTNLSLSALALNRNPKSSYSRYVEIHLMGIRILAGRRRKATKTKAKNVRSFGWMVGSPSPCRKKKKKRQQQNNLPTTSGPGRTDRRKERKEP